ncbi:MAG: hypothetical protein EBY38_01715 [Flavobacteriaceae bacterium]|nr:hypothetical protein [Flavobacteriaceae bacterium]
MITIIAQLFQLSLSLLVFGISITLSVLVYVALGLYPFLYQEANSKKAYTPRIPLDGRLFFSA